MKIYTAISPYITIPAAPPAIVACVPPFFLNCKATDWPKRSNDFILSAIVYHILKV